eukprot:TRINITY_DN2531_c0_g1_i5.p1 TRINITY_DN2531_c0_g1~~TRINITY_DN2531_c0_g1_i5.p1  ORF type:complete len:339 (-),score=65.78 TRINITY_DN2531_c0_g1_i5:30-1046(-)
MKTATLLLAFLGIALASPVLRAKFTDFMQKFGKTYANQEEFNLRFRYFQENLLRADELSKKNPQATFGVNKFSDLSQEEFATKYLMPNAEFKNNYVAPPAKDFTKKADALGVNCNPNPTNYDWNSCGVVTPIYNQGQCGSTWAFGAVMAIESYFALAGNPLTQLSTEQILDCDTHGEDYGCEGGFPVGAYSYVQSAGLEPLSDYPYTAEGGEVGNCSFEASKAVVNVTKWTTLSGETEIYQQLSTQSSKGGGPVSACIDASTWQSYTGGVLSFCGTNVQVDHCVEVTGYAKYGQAGAYWLLRNTWGTDWGVSGYLYLAIGQNLCDIGNYATIVSVAKI